jgi:hypothetical protein
VLQEAGAICECEAHGWAKERADAQVRVALEIAKQYPPAKKPPAGSASNRIASRKALSGGESTFVSGLPIPWLAAEIVQSQGKKFGRPERLDAGQKRVIAERLSRGATIPELAKEYGVGTIWRAVHPFEVRPSA